jgi:hypothetical protein
MLENQGWDKMRSSRPFRRIAALSSTILLVSWIAGGEIGRASPAGRMPAPAAPGTTVEPLPGLDVTVELDSLQKWGRGAAATLVVKMTTDLDLAEAVLSAKAPADVVFADGSKAKTWKVKPASKRAQTIPIEVIASRDGTFSISFEIEGTSGGKALHRGVAYRLQVGEDDRAPAVRHGAIEYPAVQEGGV